MPIAWKLIGPVRRLEFASVTMEDMLGWQPRHQWPQTLRFATMLFLSWVSSMAMRIIMQSHQSQKRNWDNHQSFFVFLFAPVFQLQRLHRPNKAGWLSQRSFEDRLLPELATDVDQIIAKSGEAEETWFDQKPFRGMQLWVFQDF